jgi:CBS domain-containing protein
MSQAAPEIAEGAVVADVMLRDPKTLPAGATVGQVRELLERPSVQMVLLADAGVFTGAVTELPAGVADDEPAATVADPSPLALGPDESAATAFELAARLPHRRIVVLDEQRRLLGLLCLNSTRTRFCGVPGKTA